MKGGWDWSTIFQAVGVFVTALAVYLPILWFVTREKRNDRDR
jgi:hypothetical protein